MIVCEESVEIARPPGAVFALLDDLSKTPQWNERCVEVRQTSDGPRAVGSKLVYRYREPGREGEMQGEITAWDKDRKFAMRYSDAMLDVSVGFELSGAGPTKVVHHIEIQTKGVLMWLMTPIIRRATRKQTTALVGKLKSVVEAS